MKNKKKILKKMETLIEGSSFYTNFENHSVDWITENGETPFPSDFKPKSENAHFSSSLFERWAFALLRHLEDDGEVKQRLFYIPVGYFYENIEQWIENHQHEMDIVDSILILERDQYWESVDAPIHRDHQTVRVFEATKWWSPLREVIS